MAPIIDIICHAEAYHDLFGSHVRDPGITPIGGEQNCEDLRKNYPFGDSVTCMIASPMRRCIETAFHGIAPFFDESQRVVSLLPDLQEIDASPSGTGSPLSKLKAQYGGDNLELETIREDWYDKGPHTHSAPDPAKVEQRARSARQSIRAAARIAASYDPDGHVVVVTHGEFAHWLTQDFAGITNLRKSTWHKAEVRSYRFLDLQCRDEDDDATLVEIDTPDSVERRQSYFPPADTDARRALQKEMAALHVLGHARMAALWAGQEIEGGY